MGQFSLPVLNKTGYSMFWGSVWNDPYNYTRNWKEDFLIFTLMPMFIQTTYLCLPQFLSAKQFLKLSLKNDYNFYDFDIPFYKIFTKKLNRKYYKIYFFKTWVIKFQNWILVYTSFLNTKFKKSVGKRRLNYLVYMNSIGYNILVTKRINSLSYYLRKLKFNSDF